MRRFTAAVVGLGRIGQEYDFAVRGEARVLTHASAFWHHPRFELLAGVDPSPRARRRFTQKFKRAAYDDVASLLRQHEHIDVVAMAVPTAQHREVFDELLASRPRAMVCEKPLAATVTDGRHMVRAARAQRVSILVNYMRRFEPGTIQARELLRSRQLGGVLKGTAWYSKGLLNAGSHFIDLLRFWLGEVGEVAVLARGRSWPPQQSGRGRQIGDPEPDVRISFGKTPVYFLAAYEEHFNLSAIELLGERGKLRYAERGETIEVRRAVRDKVFPGYTVLEAAGKLWPSDMPRYQWHVADHLYRHLTRGTPLNSDGASALKTLAVVEEIVQLLDTGKSV
ncbi:MAG: Gfo/Idh/MocA family oxidoreductase [Candidatus Andersenbacteria bacterium]|nr:Gfo/Idh/MocA family oxidoreductase [Candidatus Andersenbacteria bacterium]